MKRCSTQCQHPRNPRGRVWWSPLCQEKARDAQRAAGWHAIGDQLPGGEALSAGRIVTPLPPVSATEAATRRRGNIVQPPLLILEGNPHDAA